MFAFHIIYAHRGLGGPESGPEELAEILRPGGMLPASLILLVLYGNSLLIQDTAR